MNIRSPLPLVLRAALLGALFGGSALLGSQHALAEETEAARLFSEGRTLVIAKRFAEACPKFEQSQRLEPRLGTQLNVAFCHERLGKIATAWLGFQEAVITARREGDVAREQFAKGRVDALEPRVPWLRVRGVAGADADPLTILLDDAPLAPSSWGKELPVDPGEHAVVAAHVGEEYWRTTVVLAESQHANVDFPAPSSDNTAGFAPAPAPPAAPRVDGVAEATSARVADAPAASRFVFEVGAFIGYLAVDANQSLPDGSPGAIRTSIIDDADMTRTLSCENTSCEYFPMGLTSGFVAGVTGFVGYEVASSTSLGLRFLGGPRTNGGAVVALGPSASLSLGERFEVAPTVFFGTASHAGLGQGGMDWATGSNTFYTRLRATIGFAMGVGAELGMTLVSSPTGSLVLQATPLLLYGENGTAFSLPLGAAYHWN